LRRTQPRMTHHADSDTSMMHGRAEHLRSSYLADGYVIVRRLLPAEDVMALRKHAERLVATDAGDTSGVLVQRAFNASGEVKLIKASGLAERDPRFQELLSRDCVVDVVEALLGPGAKRFRDVMIVKPRRTAGVFSYHQDSAYWDVEPKALVSCWIALGDVSEEASCLRVVPGTHVREIEHSLYVSGRHKVPTVVTKGLRKLVSAAGTGDNPEATGGSLLLWKAKRWLLGAATRHTSLLADLQDFRISPSAVSAAREVMLPVGAGDVIFFHSLLWHASGPNSSDEDRFAEIVSFMSASAQLVGQPHATFPRARRT
jgi:ectoine hydroxylase-related dioxygenase (phytanoyl-CoA dioxygenase family)